MKTEIKKWLSQLPIRDESTVDYIELEGLLFKRPSNIVKLIVGKICFEIDASDLLKIEKTTQDRKFSEDSLIPVRAQLRKKMSILDAYPSDLYKKLMPKSNRPFALCVQEDTFRGKTNNRFHVLEMEFLRKHNLLEE